MEVLNPLSLESSEMVEQAFEFWFNDKEHIRSPFPQYIRPELRLLATEKFYDWAANLNEKAKDEINDDIVCERFEEIIFEAALDLVLTEDEKITIKYPFLPRLDDSIYENAEAMTGESTIVFRNLIKEGDHSFMHVRLKKIDTSEKWETKFELPE